MKYNTGNPLGSADPRDLYDTATIADNLVHGEDPAYTDRLGKSRKSWAGMEQDFADFLANSGYELLGDYAAGIEVTAYNQIIREGGEFWRAAAGTTLPYTTTGAGMPEGGAFVAVGDAVLRQELGYNTAGQGSDLITHTGTSDTVTEALDRRTIYVGSVAELESLSLTEGVNVYLTQEGRAGEFVVKTGTPPSDPQKGIYIVLANGNYAERVREGSIVNVQWFGAVGTGDSSVAIQAAYDFSSKVYFPGLPSGQRYLMDTADLVLASTTDEREDCLLFGDGKGNNGRYASTLVFGSGYGVKVNGADGNYVLRYLETRGMFFGPKDSAPRTTPIFDAHGLLYWERQNCFFQGDTLKEQPVIRLQWSLGITSRACNIFGGLAGQELGKVSDPVNQYECVSDNINGSRVGISGVCTTFKMVGGLVQSCGDGIKISSGISESSSSVSITGVYFENNKFHDGASFTGRDITLAEDGFVRALKVEGNYHAQLAADNAFTSGQGRSDITPVRITKVIGGSIRDNFWTNGGLSSYCEINHFNSSGTRFPRYIDIINNTDLFTEGTASCSWASSVVESQKLALFDEDRIIIKDATEREIGRTKIVSSGEVRIGSTGEIRCSLLDTSHFGDVKSIKLLCSDGFDVNATMNIGVLASSNFYVNGYSLGAKASYTTTDVTLNNTKINSSGGPIIIDVNVTAVTNGGAFRIEVEYVDVLE